MKHLFFILLSSCFYPSFAQHKKVVEAKIWSKDSLKQVQYSDWQKFEATTVNMLPSIKINGEDKVDEYGGNVAINSKATGFFKVEKINGRHWVIDPIGNSFIVTAVNAIRPGKSPNNVAAFNAKFKTNYNFIDSASCWLKNLSFNTAGSWSDVSAIQQYNQANHHVVYTTQLSVLAAYKRYATKLNVSRKKESELIFILDDSFPAFCDNELKKIVDVSKDSNLLGHFSDNEIPFTNTEFKELYNQQHPVLMKWINDHFAHDHPIDDEVKNKFMAFVAQRYYEVVSKLIKKNDPNHLYIGTRLHSNAKNNPYLLQAINQYVDIASINYYGNWEVQANEFDLWTNNLSKPFFITEFYTKAEETGMANKSGAGWIVKTHQDRGIHYQNFCLKLIQSKNCVGWHWFRFQDNDPNDKSADPSNSDSNKGIVDTEYNLYNTLGSWMKELNQIKYQLVQYFDQKKTSK